KPDPAKKNLFWHRGKSFAERLTTHKGVLLPCSQRKEIRLPNLMLMGKDVTEELLRRYLAGECSPEEEELVNSWYQGLDGKSDVSGIIDLIDDEGTESRIFDNVKLQIEGFPQHEIGRPVHRAEAWPTRSILKY